MFVTLLEVRGHEYRYVFGQYLYIELIQIVCIQLSKYYSIFMLIINIWLINIAKWKCSCWMHFKCALLRCWENSRKSSISVMWSASTRFDTFHLSPADESSVETPFYHHPSIIIKQPYPESKQVMNDNWLNVLRILLHLSPVALSKPRVNIS